MRPLPRSSRSIIIPNIPKRSPSTAPNRAFSHSPILQLSPTSPGHLRPQIFPKGSSIYLLHLHTPPHSSRHYSTSTTGLLRGKKALITGASRGIGRAIAQRFAAEGAICVLVGRDEGTLKAVRETLPVPDTKDGAQRGHVIKVGHVADGGFWRELRSQKPIDILVNAAGVTHYSPLFATTEELLETVVATNLTGTMLGCRAIGKAMLGNKEGGSIINVASLLGVMGGKGSAGYVASKAGVIGLTRALAAEVGKSNIRVNVIVPGYVETDMTAAMTPEARSAALNAIPLQRFGEPSEVADAAVFLATNKYANNCVLNLDGGLSAK